MHKVLPSRGLRLQRLKLQLDLAVYRAGVRDAGAGVSVLWHGVGVGL